MKDLDPHEDFARIRIRKKMRIRNPACIKSSVSKVAYNFVYSRLFENIECEWPLFFCYLVINYCFQVQQCQFQLWKNRVPNKLNANSSFEEWPNVISAICFTCESHIIFLLTILFQWAWWKNLNNIKQSIINCHNRENWSWPLTSWSCLTTSPSRRMGWGSSPSCSSYRMKRYSTKERKGSLLCVSRVFFLFLMIKGYTGI